MTMSWNRNVASAAMLLLSLVATCSARSLPDPRKDPKACGRTAGSFVCDPDKHLMNTTADDIDRVAAQIKEQGNTVGVAIMKQLGVGTLPGGVWKCSAAASKVAKELLSSWKMDGIIVIALAEKEFCIATKEGRFGMNPSVKNDVLVGVQDLLEIGLTAHAVTLGLSVMKTTSTVSLKTVPPLSSQDKFKVFIAGMIPFVGFGITDNGLMIICGELIEEFCGQTMNLSGMGAAAWGNLLSDVAGVFLGGSVQQIANRLGAAEPPLSVAQRNLPSTIQCKLMGEALGVGIGCYLGMAPLVFAPAKYGKKPESESAPQLRT